MFAFALRPVAALGLALLAVVAAVVAVANHFQGKGLGSSILFSLLEQEMIFSSVTLGLTAIYD